jgi:Ricin-type beta-trefoil lectin domain
MPRMAWLIICALIAAGVAASMAAAPATAAPAGHHPRLAGAAAPSRRCSARPGARCLTPDLPDFLANIVAGVGTNMCLDVEHSGTANGTNVDIYQCNGTPAQIWGFYYLGTPGLYRIQAGVGSNMCLDDFGGSSANYANVDIWQCNGHTSQLWLATGSTATAFHVFGSSAGPCLDVYHSGTANYTNADIYQCNGTAAQSWTVELLTEPPG